MLPIPERATQDVAIYVGFIVFIVGIIGNSLNAVVFLTLRTFREKPTGFYLIIMSFVNIGNLMTGLLSRIIISGFCLDWTLISPVYCKLRWYILQFCILTSFTCLSLAAIDQYMSTCSNLQWRQWNNIKKARHLTITVIIGWLLHGILYLVYFDIVRSPVTHKADCDATNPIFRQYHIYGYLNIMACILPLIVNSSFGLLALLNIQNSMHQTIPLVRRSLDKQLTKMVLHQLLYNFIFTLPYSILSVYTSSVGNINDPYTIMEIDLANVITMLLYYMSFACPFYI